MREHEFSNLHLRVLKELRQENKMQFLIVEQQV
jgi:hypothetical protein